MDTFIDTNYTPDRNKPAKGLLYYLLMIGLSLLVTIPLFIIVYRYIPDLIVNVGGEFRIDHILTFLIIFGVCLLLISLINKYIIYSLITTFFIFILISQISGFYSFTEAIKSYRDMLAWVEENPVKIPFLKDEHMRIRNSIEIEEAINYNNPELRNFAVKASTTHFSTKRQYAKYGNVVRYFSVFKVINNWDYVPDPQGEEFYSFADKSCDLMAGDCDDHAILMAAAIKSIGGEVRLIQTKGHLYPEVKVGNIKDMPDLIMLIKKDFFYKESLGKSVYYHLDSKDDVWMNFDYTAKYPGGPFMDETIIGILEI